MSNKEEARKTRYIQLKANGQLFDKPKAENNCTYAEAEQIGRERVNRAERANPSIVWDFVIS